MRGRQVSIDPRHRIHSEAAPVNMGHITYNPGAVVRYKNRLRMVYGNDTYMGDVQDPAVTVLGFPASGPQLLASRIAVGGEM